MPIFYKDKPVVGFDVGRSSIKVMQIDRSGAKPRVIGYGTTSFDSTAIEKGVVKEPLKLIKPTYDLFTKQFVGTITSKRLAVSLPNAYSFSRVVTLPRVDQKDLRSAVSLEVDQSIPLPIDELYYDFAVTRIMKDTQEVQIDACPKNIIDSYLTMFEAMGFEVALFESNISAITRIVINSEVHEGTTLIVDIGSTACDLSVYDGTAIRATGTIDCSGERMTQHIADKLDISEAQAHSIKTRYGLEVSKKQALIVEAAEIELTKLISEIRKVMRYFSDRPADASPINQIIVLGGGANLPGLSGYITDKTRVPTRLCAPWSNLTFGKLQPPHELETTLYTTAGGLGLITSKDLSN